MKPATWAAAAAAICLSVTALAAPASGAPAPTVTVAIAATETSTDLTPDTDGTTNLGSCDSLEALTAGPTPAFVCTGTDTTDFGKLRGAYRTGGMAAVAKESLRQGQVTATASGGTQLTGYRNVKNTSTSWTFYATVIYGTIRTDGTLTEYGRFFTRDDIALRGNYADFKFNADRTQGSALRFELSNWFSIITGGGSWSSTPKACTQSSFSGSTYYCNHSYSISGYVGNGFYGKSRVKWWNQYSPNPSSSDGSWSLTESHGPMDCVSGRSQPCQYR